MGLWPSRGLKLMGFEIKAGRGDWLGELRNPRKAESIARFCDQWWVVATQDVILLLPAALFEHERAGFGNAHC
jgi:hypothetical protein